MLQSRTSAASCCCRPQPALLRGLVQQPARPAQQTHHRRQCAVMVHAQQQPQPQPPQQQQPQGVPPPLYTNNPAGDSATPRFQDMSWREFKERVLRPSYLPASFTLGALTIGLRVAAANYTVTNSPLEFLATAASTGVMCMALAWVLFDFSDTPPPGGNFSSPRK